MAAQRVRTLFLSFIDSPCKTIIDAGVNLSKRNGWATEVYCIDGIVTDDGHCKWLLERVIRDTVTMAGREQAQLLVFYGGYGTSSNVSEEAVLHGSVTGEAGMGYNSSFSLYYLLAELSNIDQNCLLVLHTSISAGHLAIWRDRNSKSTRNLQVLLFHEDQSLKVTYFKDEQGNTVKDDQGVDLIDACQNEPFQQLGKAKDALSDMIKTCYYGKLQLNESFRQKLNDIGLQYTAFFHDDTIASFALESFGQGKATASESSGNYKKISVFLLVFNVPGWPEYDPQQRLDEPRLRLELLSSVLKKCYDFEVELFQLPHQTGFPATKRVIEALRGHTQEHNHDDSLLIFCYSGEAWTSPTDNDIHASPYADRRGSVNMTDVDRYLHDNVKSDVLRIMDCEHAATLKPEMSTTRTAKADKSKSKPRDRVFELITSNDRETLFERVIGRLINRARSSFTVSDLKHDLQDVDPNSARDSRPRRRTAGPNQGKAIPPKTQEPQ
ncbi:hypothetical protein AC579_2312 [Pseudocercospora musae]|uniref:Uncharacterized protein n=1 Tax=Pseudocercospora musae TaxID=113226 RepID=A0A139I7R3_9PEZI|nr:hypothetical protein AC579_2312 [Pseudocercospora musae]